jgi:hypothetical protein
MRILRNLMRVVSILFERIGNRADMIGAWPSAIDEFVDHVKSQKK